MFNMFINSFSSLVIVSPTRDVLKSYPLIPVNVALFGRVLQVSSS